MGWMSLEKLTSDDEVVDVAGIVALLPELQADATNRTDIANMVASITDRNFAL